MEISELIKVNKDNFISRLLRPFIPKNLILEELDGLYGNTVIAEQSEIIEYYRIYDEGMDFNVNERDYIPAQLHFKKIKFLLDKEARFMFSASPDVFIKSINSDQKNKEKADIYQKYINEVLKKNHYNQNIVKAGKDCFIGKRIAIICNFSEEYGISINFIPSLEFIYDVNDYGELTKIICFFSTNNEKDKNHQRITKKKYWLENNICHVSEIIYDGNGEIIETIIEDEKTLFDYIPAVVILNDGLTGNILGESEVRVLMDYEEYYSKMANADMDAEKSNMNSIKYALDISPNSTKNLSISPGAFWDLKSDPAADSSGTVGTIEGNLSYSDALDQTLERIKQAMYEQIDMPMVSGDDLRGMITSGKTLRAIYWPLIVRCDEKFLSWKYNLELIIKCIIDGAFLYPKIASKYINEKLPELEYTIDINNRYPIPDDEESEKEIDLSEVSNQTMSKKSYMKKWRNLTDEEAETELKQLALERQLLEESYYPNDNYNNAPEATGGLPD